MSRSYAIATPSHAGDFARCRLLCASIDRYLSGHSTHYLLVEDADLSLFKPLAGPRRTVLPESALLPGWLKARPDPLSLGRRRVWTGLGALRRGVPPLRGWHAQQLRKLALPLAMPENVVIFADSDMMFLRPFDLASLSQGEAVRLYVKPGHIRAEMTEHAAWCRSAASLLGLPAPTMPSDDYINNLVSWRREHVVAMLALIAERAGRDWVSAIGRMRRFSEYLIYGYYVDRVLGRARAGHFGEALELCKVYWGEDRDPLAGLSHFEEVLAPGQVAVGVQSFIGTPVAHLQALFEAQPDAPSASRRAP